MADIDTSKLKGKRGLSQQIASRATDPYFYATLEFLPNPDTVLRKLGKQQEIYDDIMSDAHVMGDLRSVRSALLGFEWRVTPGGDDPASVRAFELCEKLMQGRPANYMQWSDIIWTKACAVFKGYSVHEVVWKRDNNVLMPNLVADRPQNRFLFGLENELRLKTKEHPMSGEPLGDHKWLVTRHMASFNNPYGMAVFSTCFWPYVFKHSGFKYFAKFCEKYGIPKAIGKTPRGTPQDEQDKFADNLAQMVEDSVAVIPDDGSVDLLEHSVSGESIQAQLINMCNKEISKALTSQTLATEIQGQGSRAAAETHRERETTVNQSDRAIIEDTFNQLFQWITEINVAGATAPEFEFFEEAQARNDMADFIRKSLEIVPLSRTEIYERLQMSEPEEDEDIVPARGRQIQQPDASQFQAKHGCPNCGNHHFRAGDPDDNDPVSHIVDQAVELGDEGIEELIQPIDELLRKAEKEGLTLEEFEAQLSEIYPVMDDSILGEQLRQAMLTSYLQGMDDADSSSR